MTAASTITQQLVDALRRTLAIVEGPTPPAHEMFSAIDAATAALAAFDALPAQDEAAAHIEALEAENVKLREALKPFAREAPLWHEMWADDFHPVSDTGRVCSQCGNAMDGPERANFCVGDLRRARAALSEDKQ